MNIVVCIKQVPEAGSIKIDSETHRVDRENLYAVMNPFDESALETALRLKETYGGHITVVTMGPLKAASMLRKALSCGADQAVLISDPAFGGSDAFATSYILSLALKKLGAFQLLLFGRQATDGDTGQVGPETAEQLDLPVLTFVRDIKPCDTGFIVERISDAGTEHWTIESPCALTVIKENNELRTPLFERRMSAKSEEIQIFGKKELSPDLGKIGQAGSPTRVVELKASSFIKAPEILEGTVPEKVSALIENLEKRGVLK